MSSAQQALQEKVGLPGMTQWYATDPQARRPEETRSSKFPQGEATDIRDLQDFRVNLGNLFTLQCISMHFIQFSQFFHHFFIQKLIPTDLPGAARATPSSSRGSRMARLRPKRCVRGERQCWWFNIHGCAWMLMDINGYQWILMDVNGY